MERSNEFKVIVIGSGPAGCTAALYLARANLAPLVIEGMQPGGQLTITTDVENYPGFPEGVLGPKLMDLMRQQAERFGAVFRIEQVESVDFKQHPFTITTDQHQYEAYAVIVAAGASAMQIGLPSEKALQGFGVSYCATCDGFFFKNKEIVVVGGGDSAMEEATFLTKFASKVTIVHRREALRASKIMQERARSNSKIEFVYNSVVDEVIGTKEGGVTALKIKNIVSNEVSEMKAQGLFVATGHTPNTSAHDRHLELGHPPKTSAYAGQLELDEGGYIVQPHRHSTATNIQGVFAAGDCVDHIYRQAVTAAGSGCEAALACERWLTHERIAERWDLPLGEEDRL